MKNRQLSLLIVLSLATISAISFFIFGQSPQKDPPPNDAEQINKVITDYWAAAQRGGIEAATPYLTEPPQSFRSGGTGCTEQTEPTAANQYIVKGSESVVLPQTGVNAATRDFAKWVQDRKLGIVQMERRKIFGRNAIFDVSFEGVGVRFATFLLLTKIDGRWKIFLIDPGPARLNKNFGECVD